MDAGVDPVSWVRLLRKAHTRGLDPEAGDGTVAPGIVRESADADGLVLWTAGHEETLHAGEVFKKPLHGRSPTAAPVHVPRDRRDAGRREPLGRVPRRPPARLLARHGARAEHEAHLLHEATRRDVRPMIEYVRRAQGDGSSASAVVNRAGAVVLQTPNGWLGSRLRIGPDGIPSAPADEELTIEPLPAEDGVLVRRGGAGPAQRAKLRLEALGRERVAATVGGHAATCRRNPRGSGRRGSGSRSAGEPGELGPDLGPAAALSRRR